MVNGYGPGGTDAAVQQLRAGFPLDAAGSPAQRVTGYAGDVGDVDDPAVAAQLVRTAVDAFGCLHHLV